MSQKLDCDKCGGSHRRMEHCEPNLEPLTEEECAAEEALLRPSDHMSRRMLRTIAFWREQALECVKHSKKLKSEYDALEVEHRIEQEAHGMTAEGAKWFMGGLEGAAKERDRLKLENGHLRSERRALLEGARELVNVLGVVFHKEHVVKSKRLSAAVGSLEAVVRYLDKENKNEPSKVAKGG